MRILAQAVLATSLLYTLSVNAKENSWSEGLESATGMYSCLSAKEEKIVVWVNKNKEVVAVGSAADKKALPNFIYPMFSGRSGDLPNIKQTKSGYKVNVEGPSYDLDYVLVAGDIRFSCVETSDD